MVVSEKLRKRSFSVPLNRSTHYGRETFVFYLLAASFILLILFPPPHPSTQHTGRAVREVCTPHTSTFQVYPGTLPEFNSFVQVWQTLTSTGMVINDSVEKTRSLVSPLVSGNWSWPTRNSSSRTLSKCKHFFCHMDTIVKFSFLSFTLLYLIFGGRTSRTRRNQEGS